MARKKRLPTPSQSQHLEVLYMRDLNKLLAPATLILKALKARERMRMDTMSDQAMLEQIIGWLERAIEPEQVRKLARRQMKRIKKTTDPTFSTWLDIMSGADMSFDPELAITQQRTFADMAASTRIEQKRGARARGDKHHGARAARRGGARLVEGRAASIDRGDL